MTFLPLFFYSFSFPSLCRKKELAMWHPIVSLSRDRLTFPIKKTSSPLLLCLTWFDFISYSISISFLFLSLPHIFSMPSWFHSFSFSFYHLRFLGLYLSLLLSLQIFLLHPAFLSLSPPSPPFCHLISRINGFISIVLPWWWIMPLIIISPGWQITSLIRIFFFFAKAAC